jgi:hypothetical protein
MPNIFIRKSLSLKYVTKMSFAVVANDFNATPVSIWNALYCSLNLIIKTWPAAIGMKFII